MSCCSSKLISLLRHCSLVERELPHDMDRLKLIAEIHKRPVLWDFQEGEHKFRIFVPEMWRDVAISMGTNVTVDECKRKWKNLRDAYHAEVKRIEMRIARDIMKGVYDTSCKYNSNWAYYEPMKFLKDIKGPRRNKIFELLKTHSNDHQGFDDCVLNINKVEIEPGENCTLNDRDIKENSLKQRHKRVAEDNVSSNCQSWKSKREKGQNGQQSLIESTHLDVPHSSNIARIYDADYNFLVSFIPQMKKMNELQNLQFRAKMSDFIYNIMSTSATRNNI